MTFSAHLDEVVAHVPGEDNVCQQSRVVTRAEADLYQPLSVAEDVELREHHVR